LSLPAAPLIALLAIAQAEPTQGVYRATTDRVAMKFAFYSPTGRVGSVDLSEVNRWVDAAVEENTDLEVSEVADQIVDKCVQSAGGRRRLTCLVEESSEEWMARRQSLPPNYNELKHELRGSRNHPRYVLILSAAAAEAGDRLAALLIDVESALEHVHAMRVKSPQPTAEEIAAVEEKISSSSVIARPPIEEGVTSGDRVRNYVQTLIEQQLREAFTAAGRWRPFGTIEVKSAVEDPFAVEIDGVSLGTTVKGRATIVDVRPGQRSIALKNESFEEYATTVAVETGKTAYVEATPIKKPSEVIFALRQAVLWGGVVSAAAGIGVMIYGAVALSSHDRMDICLGSTECSTGFQRFGDGPNDPTASANGGGPPIFPLGYSLVGLGAAWMLGPLLDNDEERIPWIEAVVGIAVFGAAFGISLAVDKDDPVCTYHDRC
jgi:hypothetical protein